MKFVIKVDKRKLDSVFTQVTQALFQALISEKMSLYAHLPSPKDLALEYNLDLGELDQFYQSLVDRGLIEVKDGHYSKTASKVYTLSATNNLSSLTEMTKQMSLKTNIETIKIEKVRQFEVFPKTVKPEGMFLKLTRLNYMDEKPQVVVLLYLNMDLLPGIEHTNFDKDSYYTLIQPYAQVLKTTHRYTTVTALDETCSKLLHTPKNHPALRVVQNTFNAEGVLLIHLQMHSIHEALYIDEIIPV